MSVEEPPLHTECQKTCHSIKLHLEEFELMLAKEIQPIGGYFSSFICRAYSLGHTAIRYEKGRIYPNPSTVYTIDGREYLLPQELQVLTEQIRTEIEESRFEKCIQTLPYIALPIAYTIEQGIAQEIRRIGATSSVAQMEFFDSRLNPQQLQAVQGALGSTIAAITGGPGTGKTFTAGLLLSKIAQTAQKKLHVALLAPTGRAVKNLYSSIMRFLTKDQEIVVEAKTIHRSLCEQSAYLPYNIVIVDEASMIDAKMMLQLIRRVHKGTQVLFLGDANQLPSIDPGQPFFDMIKAKTPLIGSFQLTECVRTENQTLRGLSKEIIAGNSQGVIEILQTQTREVEWIDLDESSQNIVLNTLKREIFDPWHYVKTLDEAQRLVHNTALLCSVRKGPFGSEAMNQLGGRLSSAQFRPVVSTKNSYQFNVMNSDLGTLDLATGLVYFSEATIPSVLCCGLENAYAMTVHKSQGSEFNTVIFFLAQGMICDIKLFYTAITRAKQRVILMASKKAIIQSLEQSDRRESILAHLLQY